MTAIAAVDMALWDILGKTLDTPVYQLLGGASRDAVMVYGHANGSTEDDTVKAVQEYIGMGYKAVRAQCAIPGVVNAYGVGRGTLYYEPAQKGMPLESVWSTERYLDFVPPLFERLRREVGFDVHLLHDVHHRLTPIEAARLGKSLEPSRLFWLEDPVPAENQAAFRTIRQHTTTPIAVGEVFNTIYDCAQLIEEELIDYIRMTVVHGGGSATCARSRRSPSCTTCARDRTARPISARSRWRRRCTSTSASTTSASRSTCATPPRPTRSSRTRTHSSAARCTQATRPALAWTSTRCWRQRIPTIRRTCRSTASSMGRCIHGDAQRVSRDHRRRGTVRLKPDTTSGGLARGGPALAARGFSRPAGTMRFGYAAITWGADIVKAIDDISAVGFKAIQLRGEAFAQYGDRPAALREQLERHKLAFAVLSSGNLSIDPAREQEMLALHVQHARFVRDCGGQCLQVIDERPKGRAVVADDYRRLGRLMTELGKRTADVGVPLVYHHHMNSTGEKPQEVRAVLDAADPRHVRLLFDVAHYQQGGGDPVAAIRSTASGLRSCT